MTGIRGKNIASSMETEKEESDKNPDRGSHISDGWYYRAEKDEHDLAKGPYSGKEMKRLYADRLLPLKAVVRYGSIGPWRPASTYFSSSFKRRLHLSWGHVILPTLFIVLMTVLVVRDGRNASYSRPSTPEKVSIRRLPSVAIEPLRPFPPPPALQLPDTPERLLTRQNIITWTNEVRTQEMLPPLTENRQLSLIAAERVDDMFKRQYFAHISPSRDGVADIAAKIGYRYRALAENIAKGPFQDEGRLVQGWFQSRGHKENMLSRDVEEIGVGVGRGNLNGEIVWVAVQVFGRPALPASGRSGSERTSGVEEVEKIGR